MTIDLKHIGAFLSIAIAFIFFSVLWSIGVIPQPLEYHEFIDSKTLWSIPNFWNVISNLPFVAVGIMGLSNLVFFKTNKVQYAVFFLSIALVGLGSGYYHFNPNNSTLVWDRLPMTLTFMSLCSILISECINNKLGKQLLYPLLSVGIASVLLCIGL